MNKKISVIGASIGGLVAAAKLVKQGFDVTVVESGKSIGGLYQKIETPFGTKELGMHVIYASEEHYSLLCTIFGTNACHVLRGTDVDIGASLHRGEVCFDSHYPDFRSLPNCEMILKDVTGGAGRLQASSNALEEVCRRFGAYAGKELVAPILEKLWLSPAEVLTSQAIHCFFDLRRLIVCDKDKADSLKSDPWLDNVIGNPVQSQPHGRIFNNRIGLTFVLSVNLESQVEKWAADNGVALHFNRKVLVDNGVLLVDGVPIKDIYDGCIVCTPVQNLLGDAPVELEKRHLSIFYVKIIERIADLFPSYYILCYDSRFKASRIVNYDAYRLSDEERDSRVLAVEVLHSVGSPPSRNEIEDEVRGIFPGITIEGSYQVPRSLGVPIPSLANSKVLSKIQDEIERKFDNTPIYFAGMRADAGIFFSHHTIGLAYESALHCCTRLS